MKVSAWASMSFLISALPVTSNYLSPKLLIYVTFTFPFLSYLLNYMLPWRSYITFHLFFLYTLYASPSSSTFDISIYWNSGANTNSLTFYFTTDSSYDRLIFFYSQLPSVFHADGPSTFATCSTGPYSFLGLCSGGSYLDLLFGSTQ